MSVSGIITSDSPELRDRKLRFLLWAAINELGGKLVIDQRDWDNVATDAQFGIVQERDLVNKTFVYESK